MFFYSLTSLQINILLYFGSIYYLHTYYLQLIGFLPYSTSIKYFQGRSVYVIRAKTANTGNLKTPLLTGRSDM
jgi:hypothetical protein